MAGTARVAAAKHGSQCRCSAEGVRADVGSAWTASPYTQMCCVGRGTCTRGARAARA